MATPIIMPKFGQMTEESAIVEWLKKEGDKVAKGDILFTVETDKSVMEVESFEAGTLLKIVVPPGVSVPVQSTVGFLGQPGEADSRSDRPRPVPAPKPAEAGRAVARRAAIAAAAGRGANGRGLRPRRHSSPARTRSGGSRPLPHQPARGGLGQAIASLTRPRIKGTGPQGRVVEKDVQALSGSARLQQVCASVPPPRNSRRRKSSMCWRIQATAIRRTHQPGRRRARHRREAKGR